MLPWSDPRASDCGRRAAPSRCRGVAQRRAAARAAAERHAAWEAGFARVSRGLRALRRAAATTTDRVASPPLPPARCAHITAIPAALLPPSLLGLRVLELGAGIGRFTGLLAATASRVHAVDFMPNLIEENERLNKARGNTTFEAADVMTMAFDADSYDFVFTNWLFMYLGDAELAALAPRLLRCLPAGGRLFFRESCNRQSGDRGRSFNPSHYRAAADYTTLFENTTLPCGARFRLEATG
jgi:SAM-dependent methyltransferase